MTENPIDLLDPRLLKWIRQRGWQDLHPVQKNAIVPILKSSDDIIISASTASGKTEAAFLPALTYIAKENKPGIRILCISPLKALINDQTRRLKDLTENLKIAVTPWHGDSAANNKKKLFDNPQGILLITPESLESLLMNHNAFIKEAFKNTDFVIIDEFHAFMGTQRGYQLQSQLHRIENSVARVIRRIAISATFSNLNSVTEYLRPNNRTIKCDLIKDDSSGKSRLAVQVRGYIIDNDDVEKGINEAKRLKKDEEAIKASDTRYREIAGDIFRLLRGTTNLVFTNSRAATEVIASDLHELCSKNHVPQEFFPHHGSLSKDMRESLEARLQEGRLPTTAICTATLELGIDISNVASIGQISPPLSVASLRQRLGRSGRRDGLAVLRLFIPEYYSSKHYLTEQLSEDTVLSAAMIKLLLNRWYEPPLEKEYSFSTLVQQTLSVIAANGSVSAKNLWELLCKTGPFNLCTSPLYANFLRSLAEHDLIVQLRDGTLTLGLEGERLCSQWKFYASFETLPDYVIEYNGKHIGTIPLCQPIAVQDTFLFAGNGWIVSDVNTQKRIISVKPYKFHASPLSVSGNTGFIHDEVRMTMFDIYMKGNYPPCLNSQAKENLSAGRDTFFNLGLDKNCMISGPQGLALFPWKGDRIMRTVSLMLAKEQIKNVQYNSHIELEYCSIDTLKVAVANILRQSDIKLNDLVMKVKNLETDKFDYCLSDELKRLNYAHRSLDLNGALTFFRRLAKEL